MDNKNTIAIVGFGVSGLCAFTQLIDNEEFSSRSSEILIVDANPIAESNIFHCATDDVYLNTSASLNSVVASDSDHFYNWAVRNWSKIKVLYKISYPIEKKTFLPRNVFFHYMEDVFKEYLEKAQKLEIPVKIIKKYVKEVDDSEDSEILLKTSDNNVIKATQVIFSIGDGNCKNPYAHLEGTSGYLKKPSMSFDYYDQVTKHKSVLVLGTMLSAVDAAMTLKQYDLTITLASRTGTFPAVREAYQDNTENYLEFQKITTITLLLEKLLEKLPRPLSSKEDVTDLTKKPDLVWCHYIAPFLNRLNELWPNASEEEQKKFKIVFELYRVRRFMSSIPRIVADMLAPHVQNKKIIIRQGLVHVLYENGKFKAHFDTGEIESFDACINGTAATNNAKTSLDLKKLSPMNNVHVLGDSNQRNYINNGIFLFVRAAHQVVKNVNAYLRTQPNKYFEHQHLPAYVNIR